MLFELEEREGKFAIVHCNGRVDSTSAGDFMKLLSAQVAKLPKSPDLRVVVDLKDKAEIPTETLDLLMPLGDQLTAMQKKLYFVHVPEGTASSIEDRGMEEFIHILYGSPIKERPKRVPTALQAETTMLNSLGLGICHALGMLCPTFQVTAEEPRVKATGETFPCDVVGQLGLQSKTFEGILALTFPENVYLALLGEMHDTKYTSLSQANDDAASELLNILRSLSRKSLHEKGYLFGKEIPSVTRGDLTEKLLRDYETTLVVPLATAQGVFYLQLAYHRRKAP